MMIEEIRLDSTVIKFFDDYIDREGKDKKENVLQFLNVWIMKTVGNENDCNCNFKYSYL